MNIKLIVLNKISVALGVLIILSGCYGSNNNGDKGTEGSAKKVIKQTEKYANNTTHEEGGFVIEKAQNKGKKQNLFKFNVNGGNYFSNEPVLLKGSVIQDAQMRKWYVDSVLIVTFFEASSLNVKWKNWVKQQGVRTKTFDKINYQFTFDNQDTNLATVYEWLSNQPDIKSVELLLTTYNATPASEY